MRQGIWVVVLLLAGCPSSPDSPSPPSLDTPNPVPTSSTKASPIGSIGPLSITEADLSFTLQKPTANLAEAWQQTAALVVAGEEGVRAGLKADKDQSMAALGQDYVDQLLRPQKLCAQFKEEELAKLYAAGKKRFVHPDVFHVLDGQAICCAKDQAPCPSVPEREACLQAGKAVIQEAHALGQGKDGTEIQKLWSNLKDQKANFGIIDYRLAFDFEKPPEEQGGNWVIMDPAIRKALKGRKAGEMTDPIETQYGWHALFILEHKAPAAGTLETPEVRKELEGILCDRRTQAMRMRILSDLTKGHQLHMVGKRAQELYDAAQEEQER